MYQQVTCLLAAHHHRARREAPLGRLSVAVIRGICQPERGFGLFDDDPLAQQQIDDIADPGILGLPQHISLGGRLGVGGIPGIEAVLQQLASVLSGRTHGGYGGEVVVKNTLPECQREPVIGDDSAAGTDTALFGEHTYSPHDAGIA